MVIRVECPNCLREYKLSDDKAGKKFRCKDCREVVSIPEEESENEWDDFGDFGETDYDESEEDEYDQPSRPPRRAKKKKRRRSGRSAPLAGLGQRLLGSIMEGIIALVFVGPGYVMIIMAGVLNEGQGGDVDEGLMMIGLGVIGLGGMILFGIQVYLIVTRSQTVGKWVVNTRIDDYETRQPASFAKIFLVRMIANGFIGAIPCIGAIYSLVDILFIFGEEHRCLHDQLAGTYVVDIS